MIFYKNLHMLQAPRLPMPFKTRSSSTIRKSDYIVHKNCKIGKKTKIKINFGTYDFACSLSIIMSLSSTFLVQASFLDASARAFSYALIHQLLAFFLSTTILGKASFLNASFKRYFLYTILSITCCFEA